MEALFKVIDKIISLIKARDENRAALFKEVVEPLHDEFEKVVVQYFAFFRSALSELSQERLESTIAALKDQRNDYIQARIKIISMSEAIKEELGNDDIVAYCDSIKGFFFTDKNNLLQTGSSSMLDNPQMQMLLYHAQSEYRSGGSRLLRMLERSLAEKEDVQDNKKALQDILTYIEQALSVMEDSWSKASSNYAKLRVNYLLSVGQGL